MRKAFYLKAIGSTCYDESGITFPNKIKFDLKNLVWGRGAIFIKWGRQFGWANQPKVLSFVSDDPNIVRSVQFALDNQAFNLIVTKKTW